VPRLAHFFFRQPRGCFLKEKSAKTSPSRKGKAMLRILVVTARQATIQSFINRLSADPEVGLEQATSGAEALGAVRTAAPHLVIIDSDLTDTKPLALVRDLLRVNAMINTAVVSPLGEEEFHEASEGLGVLARLPLMPGTGDAAELLRRLRQVLGVPT
jgi:DNA-binding response OmpR family regulator